MEFVPGEEVTVVSVSEDLTARFWREEGGKLVETRTYRLHSGKHVWSFALQDGLLATGGADGKVALVEYGLSAGEGVWDVGEDVAREYVVLDEDRFVMTTVGGRVLVCTVSTGTSRVAAEVDGLRGWSVVAAWRGSGMVALGGRGSVGVLWIDEGRETWWDVDPGKVGGIWTSHNQDFYYFLTTSLSTPTFTLHTLPRSGHRTSTTLTPPHEPGEKRFLVTAMSLSNTPLPLLLGSRSGAIAAYDLSGTLLGCWRDIHADAVSAIKCVDSRVFTTGRSGEWSVLAVDNGALTVQHTGRAACTVLEGLSVDARVSLHGFHGKRFGVWDSSGAEVASVECGGSHRSWCFQGEWFVWTKVGKVCWFMEYHSEVGRANGQTRVVRLATGAQRVLHAGLHGREIKALAVSVDGTLLATGAEDTMIWVSDLTGGGVRGVVGVKRHTTGVQCLVWSACGGWLFSSGGAGEFYVWRVRRGVGVEVGVVEEAGMEGGDLRICGFDVEGVEGGWRVGMVYSDGTVKVWFYGGDWELLVQGRYGTCCLLQARFVGGWLVTAATDGVLAAWDVGGVVRGEVGALGEPVWVKRVHQSGVKSLEVEVREGTVMLFTGGDDCALGVTRVEGGQAESWVLPRAHASAVTAVVRVGRRVVSVGVDQRVKVWDVVEGEGEGTGLRLVEEGYTGVADVAGAVGVQREGEEWVVVGGVGVDVWRVR